MQQHNSDWMVLEAVHNVPMTVPHLVLLEHLEWFWASMNFREEPWLPSVSPFGEVIWSSNINNKSIDFNPYKLQLTNIIKGEAANLPAIQEQDLKPEYRVRERGEEKEGEGEEEGRIDFNIESYVEERERFLDYYIGHMDKAVPYPFALKEQHQLFTDINYYDQIFTSPFQLDMDLKDEEPPLWLEKARAKNHTALYTNLLTFNPHNFIQIKEKVKDYAIDMVTKH